MNKLLIISGPTATGKTALTVKLAKKYNGEIISGDSCQIYKGMDIGTGKDHPKDIKIHLIDLITPNQKFSVVDYQKLALEKIKEIQSRNKLPILVGCSGFYIDSVVNKNYNTFSIKPNKILRYFLKKLPLKFIQKIYYFLDKKNFLKLNNSDKNNPYRLIRKIEIKLFSKKIALFKGDVRPCLPAGRRTEGFEFKEGFDICHISLTAPLSFLYQRIDKRVDSRMELGFLKEIKNLLKKYKWSDPGMQIAAYQCLKPYFQNKKTAPFHQGELSEGLRGLIQKWKYAEHSDAKRQATFFKRQKNISFFDITSPNANKEIYSLIKKWYNES